MRDLQRLGGGLAGAQEMMLQGGGLLGDAWGSVSFGEGHLVPEDVGERGVPVLALERRRAEKHLVDQNAQCPPIDRTRVTATLNHFRRDVLFCSYKRVRAEVGDTRLGVDCGQVVVVRIRRNATRGSGGCVHHRGCSAGIGLLRQVKVRKHDVAGLMEKDVWNR